MDERDGYANPRYGLSTNVVVELFMLLEDGRTTLFFQQWKPTIQTQIHGQKKPTCQPKEIGLAPVWWMG